MSDKQITPVEALTVIVDTMKNIPIDATLHVNCYVLDALSKINETAKAGLQAASQPTPGMPSLDKPILTDEDVRAWEESETSRPPAGFEKIPFETIRIKRMEGHEERAEKSWEEIQKRLAQQPAVKGADPEELTVQDYIEVLEDHKRLVRELDTIINGPNAAKQASLCDIVGQLANEWKRPTGAIWVRASDRLPSEKIEKLHAKYQGRPYIASFKYGNYFTFPFGAVGTDDDDNPAPHELEDVLWLDESQSPTAAGELPADVIDKISKARDALVERNVDEAYHQLYAIASSNFDKLEPWKELEQTKATAAGDGKEAVEFKKWTMTDGCRYFWLREDEFANMDNPKEKVTTAQLYDIFKNRNIGLLNPLANEPSNPQTPSIT